jgi:hypothetical protein
LSEKDTGCYGPDFNKNLNEKDQQDGYCRIEKSFLEGVNAMPFVIIAGCFTRFVITDNQPDKFLRVLPLLTIVIMASIIILFTTTRYTISHNDQTWGESTHQEHFCESDKDIEKQKKHQRQLYPFLMK